MINRIKQYRLAAGLTPADISAMFKIPYRIVQDWEKGTRIPPVWAEQQIVTRLQAKQKRDRKQSLIKNNHNVFPRRPTIR